jgi:serine/threonine protein kinase
VDSPLGSRYRIGAPIGRGGTGVVHAGTDDAGTPVAIKVLRHDLAADPEVVARFVRERTILLGVRDPHVVGVRDMVVEGDTLAIVMDLVPGHDLRRALAAGPFPPAEAARVGAGVARGLAAVHAAGVVHRDVKPENVLLDTTAGGAAVRLTDFGISRVVTTAATQTALVGTPYYLAPELWAGERPAPRATSTRSACCSTSCAAACRRSPATRRP